MDAEWDNYKEVLRMLYFSNDPKDQKVGTLKWVMCKMKALYDFDKRYASVVAFVASMLIFYSKGQYERAFKAWGFKKNSKSSCWDTILYKREKRRPEGKASIICRAGKEVSEEKLRKEKRHQQSSIARMFAEPGQYTSNYLCAGNMWLTYYFVQGTPQTPADFTVSTPLDENSVSLLFVDNLPSLQLFKEFMLMGMYVGRLYIVLPAAKV